MAEEPAQSAQPAETSENSGTLRADFAAPEIRPKNPPTDAAIQNAGLDGAGQIERIVSNGGRPDVETAPASAGELMG